MQNWKVYKHTSPSGKVYIGITSRKNPNVRWANGHGYSSNKHFYSAIQKYGWDNIKHEILITGLTEDEAKAKEKELIAYYDCMSPNGYNQTEGGEGCKGWKMSDEQKEKIARALKGRKRPQEIREFLRKRQLGKTHTKESKEKMSQSQKGRKHTPESIAKMKEIWKGRDFSKECRLKAVEVHKKPILQYSLDGEFIKEWDSATTVQNKLGIERHSIYRCLNGKSKSCAGFLWKRKESVCKQ
jgi:group I intron endonuclease